MNSKIFVDSSVLVEYRKGNNLPFLDAMLADKSCDLFISQAVASEYLYHHLGVVAGKSPLAVKTSGGIRQVLQIRDPLPFLELFSWLPDNASMLQPAVAFMRNFNLLPNDALILAACKLHGIKALASFDPDFNAPCQGEGIRLLRTTDDFEVFKQSLL